MDCYSQKANGMILRPIGKDQQSTHQWIEGFVDDTSLFCNDNEGNKNIQKLINHLQADANLWANLLAATGGNLELQKCFYYILAWKFDDKGFGHPVPAEEISQKVWPDSGYR